MRGFLILVATCSGLLAACADFPDLETAISDRGRAGAYPRLIQVDGLPHANTADTERMNDIAKSLSARAQRLQRRARALRGPIVDQRTRAKMAAALARHPIANGG